MGNSSGRFGYPWHDPAEKGTFVKSAQLALDLAPGTLNGGGGATATSTFVANIGLPVHGWFRYSAGFSSTWARDVIGAHAAGREEFVALDPFAGVATAILAAEEADAVAIGLESHPFVVRIAQAKLLWSAPIDELVEHGRAILSSARGLRGSSNHYPSLIRRCYPDDVIHDLDTLRSAWFDKANGAPSTELTWLALVAVLRACSPVGTAPWQYVLPRKSKSRVLPPYAAFSAQLERMATDMALRQAVGVKPRGRIREVDARTCTGIGDKSVDLILTSPPYPNNYDYADATRLEMSFFGEIEGWGDLQGKVRHHLVRSCSQHVAAERVRLDDLLAQMAATPIAAELERVCLALARERLTHGGKKDYHLMVAAYFTDMLQVFGALRRVCKDDAAVCMVIGDSAPYGVHVPVDRWLGELACDAGFSSYRFEKVRDRNVKWANRKHRVPLHEGRLWIDA